MKETCNLICNGSGSSGNNYVLKCDDEILLIELGVKYEKIIKSIGYDLSKIKGVIVSHIHGDHLNTITLNKFLKAGITIYSNQEVCNKYDGINLLPLKKLTRIGSFTIQPIPVKHNVENYGFIIKHECLDKLVFLTDLYEFPYKIKDVNHWMIEANYSDDVIVNNAMENSFSQSASVNHLSIEQTLNILKNNLSYCMQTIILLHLSDNNASKSKFTNLIKKELGFSNVYIAENGINIELRKEDF